ncbi:MULTISPECIES: hypothetical protein [Dietzia]|uniref:Uncharacterized protein n=1 Tax=Dietzia cinnamea TaxID=321318 RepID=A0AAW5QAE7_9ACTN|nr:MULTISPECIES: hypothetical protein [Dietzia]MCT1640497.1 hypothetical protein [Dietzia cinnamea]MCT1864927.1 hypothetical protein [Dietzia cinnamea]MCT2030546.1 hypothetical protein [Dietzia cinnamea]MCT2034421.1 hypothetical protein [Dietzia cinnamea]MCT2062200.1 hypothetical protein [Dietzia cinnamea]
MRVFLLETLIAITVTLTTAFGGLVAEDLVARDASCTISTVSDLWSDTCTSPSRLGWFLGTLLVLVAAMALRAWLMAHNGTLYYLRLLPAESADRMRAAVDVANARSLGFRSATGWFGTADAVVDLRRQVDHISDELERAMNDDDDATGFVLAPNLAFPAALAVGYDVLLRERTHLAELPVEARRRRLPGGDTGVRTVYFDDGDDMWAERRWRSRRSQPRGELAMVTFPAGSAVAAPADRISVRRVWLSLQLEGGGPVSEVDAGHPLREAADLVVVVAPTHGAGRATAGSAPTDDSGSDTTATLRPWTLPAGRWYPGASGRQIDRRTFARLVEELSGAVEQVLDDYPEAHVLLSGRMPRSVAFALGYVISQRKDDHIEGKRAALHPTRADDTRAQRAQARAENEGLSSLSRFWTSVTPVLEHLGEAKPTIVHAAQRDAAVHGLVADAPADTAPGSATPTTDPLRR